MSEESNEDWPPPWDSALATALVGKYVLIGLTYCDHQGNVREQKQLHGTITAADSKKGFAIELRGTREGETFWLPLHITAFQDADPGHYRLRATGETVVDPDLVSTWTI